MPGPKLTHNAPASGRIKYWLARFWFLITGWEVTGRVPEYSRFVLIGAYHTSNWDFIYSLSAAFIFRLKISWMGKDTLFRWPFGGVMRALGGIPIDRSSPHGVVTQVAEQLKESECLVVTIAPEGTRKKMDNWKSGFYWIAKKANVPIVCAYLDYEKKQACIGLAFVPGDNVRQDMDRIREFYEGVVAKRPDNVTPVRLRNEDKPLA